jgi:hypothetical protein
VGYARILVSFELLRELLHLPLRTEIKSIGLPAEPSSSWEVAELTIAHPDLKNILEGERPPLITPVFRKTEASVDLIDWGQP